MVVSSDLRIFAYRARRTQIPRSARNDTNLPRQRSICDTPLMRAETPTVPEVFPAELKEALDGPARPVLVDVREPEEVEISTLAYDHLIPMGELDRALAELDPESDIVIYCRSGYRSAFATEFLLKHGFKRVRNLATGINGWAQTVDPSLKIY